MEQLEPPMDRGEIKKMLVRAKTDAVNCALALSDGQSGNRGLILLDRIKPPKTMVAELKKQFPTLRNPCFGTVVVETDLGAPTVTFTLNKLPPVMRKKVLIALRGTGFKNVVMKIGAADE